MKIKFVSVGFFMVWVMAFCQSTEKYPSKAKNYFKEIALGSEFGENKNPKILKWTSDISIYVSGQTSATIEDELDKIIRELNALIYTIKIKRVPTRKEANVHIFLGSGSEFAEKIEPSAKAYYKGNYGLYFCYSNRKSEIYLAHINLDVFRAKTINVQKHILREEFTQALGLMQDSERYPDSIFYQQWTETTNYSSLDKKVISLLYEPSIKPGMNLQQVEKILEKL